MTALRSPLRPATESPLRSAFALSTGDTHALNLPFSTLANSTGSDGRAASWWNLFRGGTGDQDVFIDPTTGVAIFSAQASPRITYSRAGLATRIGPTGLVEYGPHNLFLRSDAFDNATWNANASGVTANATAAPDGQTTAEKLISTTAAEQKWFYQSVAVLSGPTYTASVFLKAGEYQYANIRIFTGGKIADIGFYLSGSGSIYNTNTGSGTITSVGNGWYRCSVSGVTSGTTAITYINANRTAVLSESFAGDGTSGLFVWGAQLNIGPLQPYYPTGASAYYGPRITYDPVTLANLGLLVEGQATNLLGMAEDFSNAYWSKSNATVLANATTSPSGALDADKLIASATTSSHYVSATVGAISASTSYTVTVRVKAAEYSWFIVYVGTVGVGKYFNATTGAVGANFIGAPTSASMVQGPGDWWTATMVFASGANTSCDVRVYATTAGNVSSFLGDGTSGIFVWGAQLEAGSAATSYIPNPGTGTITRVADSAAMTGTDFSSWFNSAQGTFLFTARIPAGDGYLFSVSDNTANNRISVRKSSGNLIYEVLSGGATQASISVAAPTVGTTAKIAVSFISNLFSFAVNGTAGTDDTAGTVPTVSRLTIGSDHTPANHWNESAALTRYFKTSFAAAKLAALTA